MFPSLFSIVVLLSTVSQSVNWKMGDGVVYPLLAAVGVPMASNAAALPEKVAPLSWGQAPNGEFWNGHSQRFIYAPAFAFPVVEGAAGYEYEIVDDRHRVTTFRCDRSDSSLERVWEKLPTGYVTVRCVALNAGGACLREVGRRTFWKKAAFTGNYPKRPRSYALARSKVFDYFLNLKHTQYLLQHGAPDPEYSLSGYPTKMMSAYVRAFLHYRDSLPTGRADNDRVRESMLGNAEIAADYLLGDAVPAGQPLEYFTRTYDKNGCEYGRFKGEQDRIMLQYPAQAGAAFIKLYQAGGKRKYLDAAERIASTYLRLQGQDGTWSLLLNAATGKPYCGNRLMPDGVMDFFEKLYAVAPKSEYRAAADRAFAFLEKGPMRDWNWEGQFEDIRPVDSRWRNLTKHPACSVAMYLLERFPGDAKRIAEAEALVKFSEDQFVEWEPPYGDRAPEEYGEDDGTWRYFCRPYSAWMTPCALEQYNCYYPIDSSAAKLINAYLALYRVTKKREYLDKAMALGDTAVRMQEPDGLINTWWVRNVQRNDYRYHVWLNCLLATAYALDNLDSAIGK